MGPESVIESLIAYLGDSITVGYGLVSVPPPQQSVNLLSAASPPASYAAINCGVNGSTTGDWVSTGGGTPLANSLIFITRYGITAVSIMLGTNDAEPFNAVPAATYESNLQSTINTLAANGVTKLVLNQPVYNASNPLGTNALLVQYQTSILNLVAANPGLVYSGDTTAYSEFLTNAGSYFQPDGVHPNDTGATALAGLWQISYPV